MDLESEIYGFNTPWDNILLLEIFCFHVVKPYDTIIGIIANVVCL